MSEANTIQYDTYYSIDLQVQVQVQVHFRYTVFPPLMWWRRPLGYLSATAYGQFALQCK